MPKRNPLYRIYVVAGDDGEVRLIDTYYPEKIVRVLVAARNHRLCAQLTDIEHVCAFNGQRIESFAEYLCQVADDGELRRLMPHELKRDILLFLAQQKGELDTADTDLYCRLEPAMRGVTHVA